mgnify:CR=1 FL=1
MNLTILGLGLAVMGVSLGEGILVANIAKAAVPSSYCLPLATLSNRQIKKMEEG